MPSEPQGGDALQVVLIAARLHCSADEAAALREAAARVRDWAEVERLAARHRLTAFVAAQLTEHAAAQTPPDVLGRFAAARRAIAAKALADIVELAGVVQALAAAGIRAIPYKGPVLSFNAYGDFALRESIDLDIVVPAADAHATFDLLAARGYTQTDGFTPGAERLLRERHAQSTLLRLDGNKRWELDVHWRFASPAVPWSPPFDELWFRASPTALGGVTLPLLARDDELLLQLLHGARHHWASLESLVVVRELLARTPTDGVRLLAAAGAVAGRRAVLVGCGIAERLVQARLPAAVASALANDRAARSLVDEIEIRIREGADTLARDKWLLARTLDRASDRLKLVAVSAFYPTRREGEWIRLPDSLALLYWPLRVVRLGVVLLTRLRR